MQVCMGIIRAIRNYPDDLSGAVCIRPLSDAFLETDRHKTLIPLMGDFGHL